MNLYEKEIRILVDNFLASQDLKGFKYEFLKISFDEKYPNEVSVIYSVLTPDNHLIDGPAVFIVDKNSKTVRFL